MIMKTVIQNPWDAAKAILRGTFMAIQTVKGDEATHLTLWMNVKTITMSKKSQTQKAASRMTPFMRNIQTGKSIETESKLVLATGWGRGVGSDS